LKACVLFDSRYGNTEKIARSFEAGLLEAGLEVLLLNVKDMSKGSLDGCDLVCVGAPTEWHSASRHMKEFLSSVEGLDLEGKRGFAFDTRFAAPLSGSAAGVIEKKLKKMGLRMVAPRESATVSSAKGVAGATLKEGEEERFHEIGRRIGQAVLATEAVSSRRG
jgi:flavodoxin